MVLYWRFVFKMFWIIFLFALVFCLRSPLLAFTVLCMDVCISTSMMVFNVEEGVE